VTAVRAHQEDVEQRVQAQLRRAVGACLALFSEFSKAAVDSQQYGLCCHWFRCVTYVFFADVIRYALDCCERLYHETVASIKGQYARQLDTARAACRAEVLASACQFVIMYVSHVWSLLQVEERVAQAGLESADVYAPQLIASRVVRFFCGPCCAQAFDVDYRTNRHWSVLWRARTEKSWSQSMRRCSSGLQHCRGFATRCRL
jgi:hypothetical protein